MSWSGWINHNGQGAPDLRNCDLQIRYTAPPQALAIARSELGAMSGVPADHPAWRWSVAVDPGGRDKIHCECPHGIAIVAYRWRKESPQMAPLRAIAALRRPWSGREGPQRLDANREEGAP